MPCLGGETFDFTNRETMDTIVMFLFVKKVRFAEDLSFSLPHLPVKLFWKNYRNYLSNH